MDKLFFDGICRADIDSRALPYVNLADDSDEEAAGEEATTETPEGEIQVKTAEKGPKTKNAKNAKKAPTLAAPSANPDFQMLQEALNKVARKLEDGFAAMNTKVDDLALQVQDVSARVKAIEDADQMDFNDLRTGYDKTEEDVGDEDNGEEDTEEENEEEVDDEDMEEDNEQVVEEEKVEEEAVEEDKVEEDKVEEEKGEEEKGEEEILPEKRTRKVSQYLQTPYRRLRQRTKKD